MKLRCQDTADARIVSVAEPRLDAAMAIEFKDRMREIAEDAPPRVVLDLQEVEFLDSSGLGAVVAAMKLLAPERTLELSGLTPTVAKVFRLTRMDRVFTIHGGEADTGGGLARAS